MLFNPLVSALLLTRLSFFHCLALFWSYWIILNDGGWEQGAEMCFTPCFFWLSGVIGILWVVWVMGCCFCFLQLLSVRMKEIKRIYIISMNFQEGFFWLFKWNTWHSGYEKWEINLQVWVILERKTVNSALNIAKANLWAWGICGCCSVSMKDIQLAFSRYQNY